MRVRARPVRVCLWMARTNLLVNELLLTRCAQSARGSATERVTLGSRSRRSRQATSRVDFSNSKGSTHSQLPLGAIIVQYSIFPFIYHLGSFGLVLFLKSRLRTSVQQHGTGQTPQTSDELLRQISPEAVLRKVHRSITSFGQINTTEIRSRS
jgi:hypothetical protein